MKSEDSDVPVNACFTDVMSLEEVLVCDGILALVLDTWPVPDDKTLAVVIVPRDVPPVLTELAIALEMLDWTESVADLLLEKEASTEIAVVISATVAVEGDIDVDMLINFQQEI